MSIATYWNGEPCKARRLLVRVPEDADVPEAAWWKNYDGRDLRGTAIPAVEVTYHGDVFLLADDTGGAWGKITHGRGSPRFGHRSLPDDCEILHDVDA